MNAEQREHWQKNGWIVVKDVVTPDQIQELNRLYDAHLHGTMSAHPEDTAWDGVAFTHKWYNSGQVRPAEERHDRPRKLWGKRRYFALCRTKHVPAFAVGH